MRAWVPCLFLAWTVTSWLEAVLPATPGMPGTMFNLISNVETKVVPIIASCEKPYRICDAHINADVGGP